MILNKATISYLPYRQTCIRACTLILLMKFFTVISFAQIIVEGKVMDMDKNPLVGAQVWSESMENQTTTDINGYFRLSLPNTLNKKLIISYLGFKEYTLHLNSENKPYSIIMMIDNETLNEVIIKGKTQAAETRESAFKPLVVEMKELSIKSIPIVQLIELLPGIKIRQNGGLGSDYNLIVNGVSGKGIPVILDGIPVQLLSDGHQLNNLSADMIQQMEVYKGIVPVQYGVDALGGLIAIKTNKHFKSHLDLSYSYGSWNTHTAYLGSKYRLNKHQYISINGVYQHADNNYKMHDVQVTIDELGNTAKRSVNRFHDDYTMFFGKVEYGFQQTSWADDFRISISANKVKRELQHGLTAIDPWGAAKNSTQSYNSALSWKKTFSEKLLLSAQAGYGQENKIFVDTSSFTYSWDGKSYIKRGSKGESGFYTKGRLPNIDLSKSYFRCLANYSLNQRHEFNFNTLASHSTLKGKDHASIATFNQDLFDKNQFITRVFSGIAWQSKWLQDKITNILSIKNLYALSDVLSINDDFSIEGIIKKKLHHFAYSNAVKYHVNENFYTHINYERAIRLPDEQELFGDGLQILPNGTLKPEKSHNLNFGLSWKNIHAFYVGAFYRSISNQIFLNAITSRQTVYLNLRATKTVGVEFSSSIPISKALHTIVNGTWLRTELSKADQNGVVKPRHIGSRIPNTPYFFGNMGLAYSLQDILLPNSQFTITLTNRFLYRYFLGWETDGNIDQKATIPTQLLSDLSLTYKFPNQKLSVSIDCRNITNRKAYDNYKVQKPGRSFYGKIKITI